LCHARNPQLNALGCAGGARGRPAAAAAAGDAALPGAWNWSPTVQLQGAPQPQGMIPPHPRPQQVGANCALTRCGRARGPGRPAARPGSRARRQEMHHRRARLRAGQLRPPGGRRRLRRRAAHLQRVQAQHAQQVAAILGHQLGLREGQRGRQQLRARARAPLSNAGRCRACAACDKLAALVGELSASRDVVLGRCW